MVAEIIAGPITEIINNRILGNPIFHRFGKKTRISPPPPPPLIKSHADDRTISDSRRPNDLSQKTEDLNCVVNALSSWSSPTLT